jgi:hypothetical protein
VLSDLSEPVIGASVFRQWLAELVDAKQVEAEATDQRVETDWRKAME